MIKDFGPQMQSSRKSFVRYNNLVALLLITAVVPGCTAFDSPSSIPDKATPAEEISAVFDLGVVSENVLHEIVVGGQTLKTVKDIGKSCGCTSVGVREGELLDFSLPFVIRIDMTGKAQGPQSQSFRIGFTDGTAYSGKLVFDYWPLPQAVPLYLVFRSDESEKDVRLFFPREKSPAVVAVDSPSHMSWNVVSSQEDGNEELRVRIQVDRAALGVAEDGVVTIHTTSSRRDTVKIPFLVLIN